MKYNKLHFTLQTRIIYKLFEVSSQFMKYLFVKSFDGKNFKMMSGYAWYLISQTYNYQKSIKNKN
jgi:hypothetical protein